MHTIYLTFDTDWLCDEFLKRTVDLLRHYQLKATFFATHESELLSSLPKDQFEIALHPNFDKGNGVYDVDDIRRLKALYPEARGTRSHTLSFGSRLIPILKELELQYESNIYLHKHLNLQATPRSEELLSIPFNWSDDKHLELSQDFTLKELPDFEQAGINVWNFHPVHVFLNTDRYERYELAKSHFNQPAMEAHVNTKSTGIKDLLIALCEKIKSQSISTGLLTDFIGSKHEAGL